MTARSTITPIVSQLVSMSSLAAVLAASPYPAVPARAMTTGKDTTTGNQSNLVRTPRPPGFSHCNHSLRAERLRNMRQKTMAKVATNSIMNGRPSAIRASMDSWVQPYTPSAAKIMDTGNSHMTCGFATCREHEEEEQSRQGWSGVLDGGAANIRSNLPPVGGVE